MNLLDRLHWLGVSLFPQAGDPAFLHGIPMGAGPTGSAWPQRHAEEIGVETALDPDGGLIDDLSVLAGPGVDPGEIPPLTRLFYEHTGRFSLAVRPTWNPLMRLGAWFWAVLYARRWGQLELPLAGGVRLTNEIWRLPGQSNLWVRRFYGAAGTPTARALYVSRYDVIEVDGEPDPCIRISFPVPGGAWVVLFRVVVQDGIVTLTEAGGRAGGPGLYMVPRQGQARYVAALREEIIVTESQDGAEAEHTFRLWGWLFLTLSYALPVAEGARSAGRAASSESSA